MTAVEWFHYPIIGGVIIIVVTALAALLRFLFPLRVDVTHHYDPNEHKEQPDETDR